MLSNIAKQNFRKNRRKPVAIINNRIKPIWRYSDACGIGHFIFHKYHFTTLLRKNGFALAWYMQRLYTQLLSSFSSSTDPLRLLLELYSRCTTMISPPSWHWLTYHIFSLYLWTGLTYVFIQNDDDSFED